MCDDDFNITSADAICRELGFLRSGGYGSESKNGIPEESSLYVSYNMARLARPYRIKLDNVNCPEPVWDLCVYDKMDHNCGPEEKVFLMCTNGNVSFLNVNVHRIVSVFIPSLALSCT